MSTRHLRRAILILLVVFGLYYGFHAADEPTWAQVLMECLVAGAVIYTLRDVWRRYIKTD
ncbi:MAG TPA: hypothetical protein VFB58_09045 [Chloroflexota bacterium]|nr:hypothetical protein [Chloroflexota bacterium]